MGSSSRDRGVAFVEDKPWFRSPRKFIMEMEELRKERLVERRGCRSFNVYGTQIIAMNRKNAERKYELYHS